ncbi:hypothetical protein CLF_113011 [Clonorchis sinensis]|uniref:Uncharacterized protein n=1 Tax=Clonorchis sinensis TaxID=79923 RepID=G7YXG3_CLOSI|nr:hypothetical protein CLF_113011 [Clonorchis sinensis]
MWSKTKGELIGCESPLVKVRTEEASELRYRLRTAEAYVAVVTFTTLQHLHTFGGESCVRPEWQRPCQIRRLQTRWRFILPLRLAVDSPEIIGENGFRVRFGKTGMASHCFVRCL